MTTTVRALRGHLGDTEYYEAIMKVGELARGVRAARETEDWATQSIEERLQREPDLKRIRTELIPYITNARDRFFGSVIVLVNGPIEFESITRFTKDLPRAYRTEANDIGFITIEGGDLIVLDGQHRFLAMRQVVQADDSSGDGTTVELGPYAGDVPNDEICVIFIRHETNQKTRRIFNKVNRYAKSTSRGDNIITSEDDGYAIVARGLLNEGAPLGIKVSDSKDNRQKDLVNWRSNTLAPKSVQLTTISVVYETAKRILSAEGIGKLDEQTRPSDEDLERYSELAQHYWRAVLDGLQAYQEAIANPSAIPAMREKTHPSSLLFKPAAQIALFKGLTAAVRLGLDLDEAVRRADRIDWRMTSPIWKDIIIRQNDNIDAGPDATERAGRLITYLIAADHMDEGAIEVLEQEYNTARGSYNYAEPEPNTKPDPLPDPVVQLV